MPPNNAGTIRRFYEAAGRGGDIADLVAPDYRPHTPPHRGLPVLEPGLAALEQRLAVAPLLAEPHRVVADGELVFAQVHYQPAVNGADIFRLDAQHRIIEHWNIRQSMAGEGESGIAARFAGPGDAENVLDGWDAAANAARAARMYRDMWSKGNAELATDFLAENYIQHNPHIRSGAARIREMIANDVGKYIAIHQTDFPILVRHIGAQGDLVFCHFEISMLGLGFNDGARSSVVDLFRVGADGRFAEHWDVCQMEAEALPEGGALF